MRLLSLGAALALLLAAPALRAADDPFAEAMKRFEEMRRRMEKDFPGGFEFDRIEGFPRARLSAPPPRLGVQVRVPDEALVEQLDLPREQGLVLAGVAPGSAAEKAGLKRNDILLEVAGKPVPAQPAEFVKLVAGLESGKPLDAVVLRKGKKETLRGVKLPEPKARPEPKEDVKAEGFPGFAFDLPAFDGVKSEAAALTRTDDQWTATHKEGGTTVTVTGTVVGGKAKAEGVTVEGKDGAKSYAPDKVPDEYKARLEKLAKLAGGEKE
ncbi:MAG: PDZ domain-containing protein [Gemmataceae bacterium]|nr:PDZ domain-containing protein [Gemmataceae bacterium]